MAGERGDIQLRPLDEADGWLSARQEAWGSASGVPPQGAAQTGTGFYDDKRFGRLFVLACVVFLIAFFAYVAYDQYHAEKEGKFDHHSTGAPSQTSGPEGNEKVRG